MNIEDQGPHGFRVHLNKHVYLSGGAFAQEYLESNETERWTVSAMWHKRDLRYPTYVGSLSRGHDGMWGTAPLRGPADSFPYKSREEALYAAIAATLSDGERLRIIALGAGGDNEYARQIRTFIEVARALRDEGHLPHNWAFPYQALEVLYDQELLERVGVLGMLPTNPAAEGGAA